MTSMTMPLWRVLELNNDTYDPDEIEPPAQSGFTIGLGRYPIFNESQRLPLNRLIIDHFYLRDIGQETISMFAFLMKRTMREIMPTYNQLYKSQQIQFDPLATYDLTTVRNGTASEQATRNGNENTSGSRNSTANGTRSRTESGTEEQHNDSTTTGTSEAGSRSVFFDTPQTALARNKDYAANATDAETKNTSSGTSGADSTGSSTSTAAETDQNTGTDATTGTTARTDTSNTAATNADTSKTTGFQGSAADLLNRYRSTIINTDLLLLNDPELTSMFFGLWDVAHEIAAPSRRIYS